ncbi:unnamed protein product [[Actinomadura] parvosata subsp. kistnae]|nr:unnamed protein product [Actinomadura parvosata subsp. kistnae]
MQEASMEMRTDEVLQVTLRGEIDFTNSTEINKRIKEAVTEYRPAAVRVDLSAVTFIDSTGVGVLVNAMRMANAARSEFRVVGPNRRISDQLRTMGLLAAFGLA